MLEVIDPGLLSTVQDFGRPHAAALGVPAGGAADRAALAALERLVGGTGAVEMTLLGGTFAVRARCIAAITGADMGAEVVEERRPVERGVTVALEAGTTLRFGEARDGARTYLSLAGGLDVPEVLGSKATCLPGGFGGVDGRPLLAGDVLRAAGPDATGIEGRRWDGPFVGSLQGGPVRSLPVVLGPHAEHVGRAALDGLLGSEWTVDPRSDRMGVRLDGPSAPTEAADLTSFPVIEGAVQLPPGGRPIVLLADHQTVGGYPVPLVVAAVDLPGAAQLRPGDRVRFTGITRDEAHRLSTIERRGRDAVARAFGERYGITT